MAVNSASDRNNQGDDIRRTREAYQKREAEQAKQQGQQVKHLTESAQAELEGVKTDHQKQMEDLKQKTRDALSSRDLQYQKEIGDLRDMHQKQLQRIAGDAESKLDRNDVTLKGELVRQEQISGQQREVLKGHYEDQLKEKDASFSDFATTEHSQSQKANEDIKSRMSKAHEQEVKSIVTDRDTRIDNDQRDLREYRRNSEAQTKNTDRQHKVEVSRLNDNFEHSLREESDSHQMTADENRLQMQKGLQKNRDRFEKAAETLREQSEASRDEVAGTVGGRMGNRLRTVEDENRRLKADATRTDVKYRQEKSRELGDLRDSMSNNISGLEKARKETLDSVNDRAQKIVSDKTKEKDESLYATHRFYQEKIAENGTLQEARLSQAKNENEKVLGHEKVSSNNRFSRLKNSSDIKEGQLRNYFDRSASVMKDTFETTLHDMRDSNQKDQRSMLSQFTKQSQESDSKLQQQISDVGNKYELQIAQIKEDHSKELKDQQGGANRLRKEVEKKSDLELKTQASQYEYRLAKMQEMHERQLDGQRQKHEETLANLTKSRKA